jgi:predicted ATPase
LLQHAHLVQIGPVFHKLATSYAEDVCLCPCRLFAGWWHPHHFPLVRPARLQAGHHGLTLGSHLLRRPVEVGEGTCIDEEEVFKASRATHGSGTAQGEDVVGRNRRVDCSHVIPVHDLLKVTADHDRVSFWCNELFDVHWFLLLLNSSMWFNWEMCFPGGIIPAEGCDLLLLLDNFERLIPAAPQLVDLLAHCPQLKMLVTSRAVLHVQGEYEFPVASLALLDREPLPVCETLAQYSAVALFVQRAQAVRPDFLLTDANARDVVEICVHLDGLPLALELAAASIKFLSPQELLTRLSHRLEVLIGGAQDLPIRQQTLRNTILWSYQLLDAWEQRLFRRLSVFAGGCTLEAVEAVCAALDGEERAAHILESVTSLLDKSLLQTIHQEGKESRLVMLETIREYGLEGLSASGELEATHRAHALYYLRLAEATESKLLGSQHAYWVGRLEREHDNLCATLQWALEQEEGVDRREIALRIAAALQEFWLRGGHISEGRAFLERALVKHEGIEAVVLTKAIAAVGLLARVQGDFVQAEAWGRESLALFRELGDIQGIARSLRFLGTGAMRRGDNEEARRLIEEGLALLREVGDAREISDALLTLGNVCMNQGEYARASELLEVSLALCRQVGDQEGIAEGSQRWDSWLLSRVSTQLHKRCLRRVWHFPGWEEGRSASHGESTI